MRDEEWGYAVYCKEDLREEELSTKFFCKEDLSTMDSDKENLYKEGFMQRVLIGK